MRVRASLVIVAMLALTACSGTEKTPSVLPGWKSEIDLYLSNPGLTDKQRQILADYWVSDEEQIEVHEDWLQCMADAGFDNASIQGDHLSPTGYVSGDNKELAQKLKQGEITEDDYRDTLNKVTDHCEATTWQFISMYYVGMREDPDRIDPMPEVLNCLKEAEFIFADATLEQLYEKLSGDGPYNPSPEEIYCFGAGVDWTSEGLELALASGE